MRKARPAGASAGIDVDVEPMPAWARALLESQQRLADRLDTLCAQFVRAGGAGGSLDADEAVGRAIAELRLTRPYSACELFALRSADVTLRQAFGAALVDDAPQLGALLGRLHRRGLIDREPRRGPRGWRWLVRL